jgi:hypothetical protein
MRDTIITRPTKAPTHAEQAPALRCVSSGYLGEHCSCEAQIPRQVVLATWLRAREAAAGPAEGFFAIDWQGATWLSYGRGDGSIAGVYCPTHTRQRATRIALAEREQPNRASLLLAA